MTGKGPELYNGDDVADVFDGALDEVSKIYRNEWGRAPHEEELLAAFNFCLGGIDKEGG